MTGNPVLAYGAWLAETPAAWPGEAWEAARRAFVDTIAVTIPGAVEPVTRRVFATVRAWGEGPAAAIGQGARLATPWAALRASLERSLAGRLQEAVLFDEYRGPGLEKGTKSLAMGLILQEVSRTLTDSEADEAVSDALAALGRDCQARIRS